MTKTKRRPPAAGIPRKKGTQNKITRAAKEAFQAAFDGLGGVPALVEWGKKNRKHFYTLYARLIPAERSDAPGAPLVNINMLLNQHITTPEAAADAYRLLANDPTLDFDSLKFAPSLPAAETSCLPTGADAGADFSSNPGERTTPVPAAAPAPRPTPPAE